MSITVAIMSLAFERLWVVIPGSPYFDSLESLGFTLLIMLCGGVIAFFMVWTEFAVIANTSALTFMIAGTFKELVTGAPQFGFASLSRPPVTERAECTTCQCQEEVVSWQPVLGQSVPSRVDSSLRALICQQTTPCTAMLLLPLPTAVEQSRRATLKENCNRSHAWD